VTWPFDRQEWFDLEDELQNTTAAIISGTEVRYTENGLNDPVIYAATLLFRTLSSVRSVFVLASKGLLVESNIIARSCVENVLWLRGLRERGLDFVQEILKETVNADAALAKLMVDMPEVSLDEESKKLADAQMQARTKGRIQTGEITKTSASNIDYAVFRMISHNFAHPSLRSLDRYIERDPGTGAYTLLVDPEVAPKDLLWAMFIAAGTALSAVGLFLETFPPEQQKTFVERGYGKDLQHFADRFKRLGSMEGLAGD